MRDLVRDRVADAAVPPPTGERLHAQECTHLTPARRLDDALSALVSGRTMLLHIRRCSKAICISREWGRASGSPKGSSRLGLWNRSYGRCRPCEGSILIVEVTFNAESAYE